MHTSHPPATGLYSLVYCQVQRRKLYVLRMSTKTPCKTMRRSFISSDRCKRGLSYLRWNLTNKLKDVPSSIRHKVQFFVSRVMGNKFPIFFLVRMVDMTKYIFFAYVSEDSKKRQVFFPFQSFFFSSLSVFWVKFKIYYFSKTTFFVILNIYLSLSKKFLFIKCFLCIFSFFNVFFF